MIWWKELYDFMDSEQEVWYPENEMKKLTAKEVDFLEEACSLKQGASVIDVGCGRGRHCVELAGRGYKVTGIDISEQMINKARQDAQEQNLDINYIVSDMREYETEEKFDLGIFMDVAFGIFKDESNQKVVNNIYESLKPDGQVVFHLFNPYYWAMNPHCRHWGDEDGEVIREYRFDAEDGRIKDYQVYINVNKGIRRILPVQSIRAYTVPEMRHMCRKAGFTTFVIYGDTGDFIPTTDIPFETHRSLGMYFKIRK
ncbi:MAG: class I SAM-dependent methyltransferase [Vulcanimicrobiota bacterium]